MICMFVNIRATEQCKQWMQSFIRHPKRSGKHHRTNKKLLYCKAMFLTEFIKPGTTIKLWVYWEMLNKLQRLIQNKWCDARKRMLTFHTIICGVILQFSHIFYLMNSNSTFLTTAFTQDLVAHILHWPSSLHKD